MASGNAQLPKDFVPSLMSLKFLSCSLEKADGSARLEILGLDFVRWRSDGMGAYSMHAVHFGSHHEIVTR